MSFSFDPFALITGLVALFLTLYQLRRTYRPVLAIERIECHMHMGIDTGGKAEYVLKIFIRNSGRPLHNISAALNFRELEFPGSGSLVLDCYPNAAPISASSFEGEFASGMIAEFGFRSLTLNYHMVQALSRLSKPVEQSAKLVVYAQGVHCFAFNIGTGLDRIKRRWNEFASRINPLFNTYKTVGRTRALKWGSVIPTVPSLYRPIFDYTCYMRAVLKTMTPPKPFPFPAGFVAPKTSRRNDAI
jgi:hypothetical protein